MIRTDGAPTIANYREPGRNFPRNPVGGYRVHEPVACCDFDLIVNPSHIAVLGTTSERTCVGHSDVGARIRLADWRHDHGIMLDEAAVLDRDEGEF